MFQINKILSVLFIFILGAIAVEIGLFMYYQLWSVRPSVQVAAPTAAPTAKPTPAPYGSFAFWATQKKSVLVSSTKTDDSEGVITELDTKGGTMPLGNGTYPYSLKIGIISGANAFTFLYDANDMKKLKVVNASGAPMKPEGLKIGDKINIKETVDLLSPKTSLLEVTVRKL